MSISDGHDNAAFAMSVTTTVPEVTVTIFDGRDQKVHSAVGDTTINLPIGLYRVRSELHGQIKEVLVEHAKRSHVAAPVPSEYTSAPLDRTDAALRRRSHSEAAARLSIQQTSPRPLSDGPQESWLFLFVRRARPERCGAELAAGLSLLDAAGGVITTFGDDVTARCGEEGYLAFSAPMAPGYYVLRYDGSPPRETAIHLFHGYSAQLFVLHHKRLRLDGMDILTARAGAPLRPSDGVTHAAAAGYRILQNKHGVPPPALADVMGGGRFEDPMLGLLGAHLVLQSESADLRVADSIVDHLEGLLGERADVQALRVLTALRRGTPIPPVHVAQAPMLRPSLEALVAASHAAPTLITPESDLEHASVFRYTDCPFSSWAPRRAPARAADRGESGDAAADDWLRSAVMSAAAENSILGQRRGSAELARELAVPLRTVESALQRAGSAELEARPTFRLKVIAGPMQGREFVFREHDTFIFGRGIPGRPGQTGCHLELPPEDIKASRYHFLLEVNPPDARIRDLGSLNGTYVNNTKYGGGLPGSAGGSTHLRQEADIQHGDRIRVGRTVFECSVVAPSSPPLCADSPDESDVATPKEIAGYEVLELLDKRGGGRVYLGRRRSDGALAALKIVRPRTGTSASSRRRLLDEVETVKTLEHPNIVRLFDAGAVDGALFFAMEYCGGESLGDFMERRGGQLPLDEALPLALDALAGLEHAHARGFVHRDIRPSTILLSEPGRGPAKVANFGLATGFQRAGIGRMTIIGELRGSSDFMPREQVVQFKDAHPASDVWSVGATLYSMLTGSPPRSGATEKEALRAVLKNRVIPLRERDPGVPAAVASVIDRALAADPRARYEDAGAFRRDLLKAL